MVSHKKLMMHKRSEASDLEHFIDGSTRKDDLCGEIEILRNDAICLSNLQFVRPTLSSISQLEHFLINSN